ncbi:HtpN [Mycoplasma phage MAV1]|uniref:HtpN n=1 Tax=Mycoplasma phage MAV1 TaxID=75590 RepID=UPI000009BE60|nr:HtpN [Mycoplasma phage MAV1]AAC33772.1 HtpN [Mycoplasma phage MAV1]
MLSTILDRILKKPIWNLEQKIQANTLAFKVPTVKFKSPAIQEVWNYLVKKNKLLEIIQQLEVNLYKHGIYALGIESYGNHDFEINLGRVDRYKIRNNKLVQLSVVVVDTFSDGSGNYEVIREYDLTKNNNEAFVPIYAKKVGDYKNQHHSLTKFQNYDFNDCIRVQSNFIPYIVFKNNYLANSEIDDVDASLFQMLDNCLECLLRDNFWSNPFIFVVDNFNTEVSKDIKDSVYDLSKRVISTDSIALNQTGNPIEFHQGSSNTQNIISKIDKLNYLIKDQMFFKMNSADFGTKNMHNAEFENLNSNFNDYVESKANFREEYYYDFVKLFLRVGGYIDQEFKVIVAGSTEYLKSNEAIYNVDQNGVVVNNNQNPQPMKQNQKIIEGN